MDFVWNEIQAEDIRHRTAATMQGTVDDMQNQAQMFIAEAEKLQARANVMQASLPIMRSVTRTSSRTDDDGNSYTVEYTERITDSVATSATERQIAEITRRIADLRMAAKKLQEASEILRRSIENTNTLFQRMFEYAQRTDAQYELKLKGIKNQISAYVNKMEALRDSFDVSTGGMRTGFEHFQSAEGWGNTSGVDTMAASSDDVKAALFAQAINAGIVDLEADSPSFAAKLDLFARAYNLGRITFDEDSSLSEKKLGLFVQAVNVGFITFEANSSAFSERDWRVVRGLLSPHFSVDADVLRSLATMFNASKSYPSDWGKFLDIMQERNRTPFEFNFIWGSLEEILSRPASNITASEYALLAQLYLMVETRKDLQRFLNAFANPFAPRYIQNFNGIRPPNPVNNVDSLPLRSDRAYTVCGETISEIQFYIGVAIDVILGMQMNGDINEADLADLDRQRSFMMERYMLLATVNKYSVYELGNSNYGVLVGNSDGQGPFTLSSHPDVDMPSGHTLSVQTVNLMESTSVTSGLRGSLITSPYIMNRDIFISPALAPEDAGAKILNLGEESLLYQHRFDEAAARQSAINNTIVGLIRAATIKYGIKKFVAREIIQTVVQEVIKANETASKVSSSVSSAQAQSNQMQQVISDSFYTAWFGRYHQSLQLAGVLVSQHIQSSVSDYENGTFTVSAWTARSWSTATSYAHLQVLNNQTGVDISWEEFLRNPTIGFDLYLGLSPIGQGRVARG